MIQPGLTKFLALYVLHFCYVANTWPISTYAIPEWGLLPMILILSSVNRVLPSWTFGLRGE